MSSTNFIISNPSEYTKNSPDRQALLHLRISFIKSALKGDLGKKSSLSTPTLNLIWLLSVSAPNVNTNSLPLKPSSVSIVNASTSFNASFDLINLVINSCVISNLDAGLDGIVGCGYDGITDGSAKLHDIL